MSDALSPRTNRDHRLAWLMAPIVIAGVALLIRREGAATPPASTDLPAGHVLHVVGDVTVASTSVPYELWYDYTGRRFHYLYEGGAFLYQDGQLTMSMGGQNASQMTLTADFDESTGLGGPDVAIGLNPELRSKWQEAGTEEEGGITYRKVEDYAGRTLLLRSDQLPAKIRFHGVEAAFTYRTVEKLASQDMPRTAFVVATPAPDAVVGAGFTYLRRNPADFEQIYKFRDYDIYWVGLDYGNWTCMQVDREIIQGPLEDVMAESEGQPGKSTDNVTFDYVDGGKSLIIKTVPSSSLTHLVDEDPRATPMVIDGLQAHLVQFDSSRKLVIHRSDAQIEISTESDLDLVELAKHLVRIQDSAPAR